MNLEKSFKFLKVALEFSFWNFYWKLILNHEKVFWFLKSCYSKLKKLLLNLWNVDSWNCSEELLIKFQIKITLEKLNSDWKWLENLQIESHSDILNNNNNKQKYLEH